MAPRRSTTADFLAVLVCSSAFSAGGWALWKDVTTLLKPAGTEAIGTIIFKRKIAQRKYSDRAIWEELKTQATLYSYDSVRTAKDSEAKLILKDGTEISMEEDTLILLDYGRDSRNIEFMSGNITATRAEAPPSVPGAAAEPDRTVTISSKGSKVEVKSDARASLGVSKQGNLDVSVSKGKVDLVLSGAKREVKENEKAVVSQDAKTAVVEAIPLSMNSPAHDSFWLSYGEGTEIAFSWRSDPPQSEYRLEVARTPSFASPVIARTTASRSENAALPPGGYWARVYVDRGDAISSTSGAVRFTIVEETSPRGISPVDGAAFSYRLDPPSVRLMWEGAQAASSFTVEIARDAAFTDIAQRIESASSFALTGPLAQGAYWWRVRPAYAFRAGGAEPRASAAASFTVSRIAEMPATEAILPRDGETVAEKSFAEAGIRFSWKSAPEAVASTLTIARDEAMSDVAFRTDTKASYVELNSSLAAGTYWWQVSSRASDGASAPPSRPASFTITAKLPSIALLSPIDGADADALPGVSQRFAWESDSGSSFALEISDDASFASPSRRETTQASAEVRDLSPGAHYWRVSVLGPRGIVLSLSEARSFQVLSPLPPPRPVSPPSGEALDLVNAASLAFSWEPSEGADSYSFRLSARDGRTLLERPSLSATSLEFEAAETLAPGSYRYEVQAFQTSAGRTRASTRSSSSFTVKRNVRVGPPEPIEPAEGASLDELAAKRAGIPFAWKADPLAPTSKFIIARDPLLADPVEERALGGDRTSVKGLAPGDYYWSVTGRGADGKEYPSRARRFAVRKAPPLSEPEIAKPAKGEKIEMADKDALALEWKPVAGATHYSASLVNRKTGETVGTLERAKGTNWVFAELPKLDVAGFTLNVQAFALAPDGTVERKSGTASVDFSLMLTMRMGAPVIVSPDVYYLD